MGTEALILLISTLVPTVNNILEWLFKTQATLKNDAELTPEQEKTLDDSIAKLKLDPEEWQKPQPI